VNGLIRQHLNIALEKPTATAYRVSAWLAVWARNYEVALENAEKAIALDPNDPFNFNMKAHILTRTGSIPAGIKASWHAGELINMVTR
jgi:hypothetical protein